MKKLVFIIAALSISLPISALAADMPVKAPAAPVVSPPSWTGFYVGLNAGYTWGGDDVSSTGFAGPCDPTSGGGCTISPNFSTILAAGSTFSLPAHVKGFIGGGQFGYNWQLNNAVVGLEADIQGIAHQDDSASLSTTVTTPAFPANPLQMTATVTKSIDYLGTVRGRAGWLATPSLLLYGTGGLAYGKVNLSNSINVAQTCGPGCTFLVPPTSVGSSSQTRVGWTLGGGLEWMFAPRWTAKAEYLYYDLGEVTAGSTLVGRNFAPPSPVFMSANIQTTTRFNGNIARVGVNYHF